MDGREAKKGEKRGRQRDVWGFREREKKESSSAGTKIHFFSSSKILELHDTPHTLNNKYSRSSIRESSFSLSPTDGETNTRADLIRGVVALSLLYLLNQ